MDELREKVIKGLKLCTLNTQCAKEKCPYYPENDCFDSLHKDAISLLEAQEPHDSNIEKEN